MSTKSLKRKFLSNVGFARALLLISIIAAIFTFGFVTQKVIGPIWPIIAKTSLKSDNNRTNILLLGMRGEGQDGPDMTDTLIFASINHVSGQITLTTLPRDLWSTTLNAKINSAYHLGSIKQGEAGGIFMSKSIVAEITDFPIHYAVIINFDLFVKFIDLLGGLDIDIPKTFDDYKYPVPGKENDTCGGDPQTLCRYEHIRFEKGLQHMTGQEVLKYVRSRMSTDLTEGTDFARSRRQEQVINALKSKLIFQKPQKYLELYKLLKTSVITDISQPNYIPLLRLLYKSRNLPLRNLTIDQNNLLDNPPVDKKYNYQWVLIPKNNNPKAIIEFFKSNLN